MQRVGGRAIRIFLVDGSPTGLRTAELGLSTCKAVMAPRLALESLARRPEAKRTGVYVLVGQDDKHPGRRRIYVGEGDEVLARIRKHDGERDFWGHLTSDGRNDPRQAGDVGASRDERSDVPTTRDFRPIRTSCT